jgi:hypothetical protein
MSLFDLNSERGNTLVNAGYALEAIGNLLGADGSEYNLTPSLENGLQHAVVALGIMVREYGCGLATEGDLQRTGGAQ